MSQPPWMQALRSAPVARKMRLGIIGTGLAATTLYSPAFSELGHRIDLVACANRTRRKAEDFAASAGVTTVHDSPEELIADPNVEAVLISLPVESQPEYITTALRAGKAVMSEKPIAVDVATARRLLRSTERAAAPFMVGENFGYMSHAHQLARWITQGRLGVIRYAEVRQVVQMDSSNAYFNTPWRADPAHIGGFVTDGGVHIANLVRRCLGDPVDVAGFSAQFDSHLPPVDTVVAALRFESGALGTWTSCFSARSDDPPLRIFGDKANATWHWGHVELVSSSGKVTRAECKENSFTAQFRNFADVVTAGAEMKVTPREALGDLVLIDRLLSGR